MEFGVPWNRLIGRARRLRLASSYGEVTSRVSIRSYLPVTLLTIPYHLGNDCHVKEAARFYQIVRDKLTVGPTFCP
jgi:hypothetical protein